MVEWTLTSADDLRALGERLGAVLRPGHVVALVGELGAGKTTLSQGVGAALGAVEVQSPTFVVVRDHPEASPPLVHADLYRVEDDEALDQLGLEERLGGAEVALVEWADRFPGLLPADHLEVRLAHAGAHRRLTLRATGPRHAAVEEALRAVRSGP